MRINDAMDYNYIIMDGWTLDKVKKWYVVKINISTNYDKSPISRIAFVVRDCKATLVQRSMIYRKVMCIISNVASIQSNHLYHYIAADYRIWFEILIRHYSLFQSDVYVIRESSSSSNPANNIILNDRNMFMESVDLCELIVFGSI